MQPNYEVRYGLPVSIRCVSHYIAVSLLQVVGVSITLWRICEPCVREGDSEAVHLVRGAFWSRSFVEPHTGDRPKKPDEPAPRHAPRKGSDPLVLLRKVACPLFFSYIAQSFPATIWQSVLATGFALSRSNPYTRISNAELPFLTTRPRPARVVLLKYM